MQEGVEEIGASGNTKFLIYSGKVTIDTDNQHYMVENNVLYSKDKKTLVTVLYKINGNFTIDSKVETIKDYAFHNQYNMTSVTIPEGVTTIGCSFNYCSGLTTINIPSTVTSINGTCFKNSPNIEQIVVNKEENSISGAPWGAVKGMKVVVWKK